MDDVSAHATTILDLSTLLYDAKHVLAHKALVHQTDEVQVNVYILEPGGRIPAHRHSSSWDISVVIEGEIEARFTEGGTVPDRALRQAGHQSGAAGHRARDRQCQHDPAREIPPDTEPLAELRLRQFRAAGPSVNASIRPAARVAPGRVLWRTADVQVRVAIVRGMLCEAWSRFPVLDCAAAEKHKFEAGDVN